MIVTLFTFRTVDLLGIDNVKHADAQARNTFRTVDLLGIDNKPKWITN